DRRMPFTGRPDSIIGYYQYSSGGAGEFGKIRAILHTSDYYDPETPTTHHPDPTANKIADALFLTPTTNVTTWTRFSVPFTYVSASNPAYIMINATPSDNQNTTVSGSQMWLDDIAVVYNPSGGINQINTNQSLKVYYADKTVYVDLANRSNDESTLSVFDLTGKLLSSQKMESNKLNTLNVSGLNAGMYLYQVIGSTYQKAGKFIVN
ncbi:MAG TPA: T9SS type A sorting domain-containing protein, partial [Bacteroidia bacterium]